MPDPKCTPGATDPRVTQANIATTVCKPGYTKTVRPPVSLTNKIKRERFAAYGIKAPLASAELDHLISLELGGAPADVANLWPEPYAGNAGARVKDQLEDRAKRLVCSGQMTLAEAQRRIAADWVEFYRAVTAAPKVRKGH